MFGTKLDLLEEKGPFLLDPAMEAPFRIGTEVPFVEAIVFHFERTVSLFEIRIPLNSSISYWE